MSEVSLAKGVVEVVAKGVDKTIKDLEKTQKAADEAGKSFGKMSDKFLKYGAGIGLAGGIALGIFGKKAMEGTVEAEKFSLAITRFFRVTGDALAPYVRGATSAINSLTKAFYSLSPFTKDLFVKIAIGATAFGVLSGGIIASKMAFAGVMPFIKAFTGMIGAAVGIFSTLGAAAGAVTLWLGGVFDSGISGGERMVRTIETVLAMWEGLKEAGRLLYDIFKTPLNLISDMFAGLFNWIGSLFTLHMVKDGETAAKGTVSVFSEMVISLTSFFGAIREAWVTMTGAMKEAWAQLTDFVAQGVVTAAQKTSGWMEAMAKGISSKLPGLRRMLAEGSVALREFAPEGVEKVREEDAKRAMDARRQEREKDIADAKEANKKIMDDLKDRLKKNRVFGEGVVKPMLAAWKAMGKEGGFKMKVGIEIGTIQSAFDRIAVAVANASNVGATVEQQQLGVMKDMDNKLGVAVNGINALKNVVPAVGN